MSEGLKARNRVSPSASRLPSEVSLHIYTREEEQHKMRVTRLLLILMLCAGIDVAQGGHGQCSVTDRYRVRRISLLYNLVNRGLEPQDPHV